MCHVHDVLKLLRLQPPASYLLNDYSLGCEGVEPAFASGWVTDSIFDNNVREFVQIILSACCVLGGMTRTIYLKREIIAPN